MRRPRAYLGCRQHRHALSELNQLAAQVPLSVVAALQDCHRFLKARHQAGMLLLLMLQRGLRQGKEGGGRERKGREECVQMQGQRSC